MTKKVLIIGLLLLSNLGFSQQSYIVEDSLYNCLSKLYASVGVDLKNELNGLEKELIDNDILQGVSGQDYYNFYSVFINEQKYPSITDCKHCDNIINTLTDYSEMLDSTFCNDAISSIDSLVIENSRLTQTTKAFNDTLEKRGDIDANNILKVIHSIMKPEDYEHSYYKYQASLFILMIAITTDFGIERKLPPKTDNINGTTNEGYSVLEVMINSNDEILVDGKTTNIKELKSITTSFINEHNPKYVISLRNDRGTSIGTFINVQNELTAAINEVRNTKAKELYNKTYDELDKEQKRELRKLVPLNISEGEPTDID